MIWQLPKSEARTSRSPPGGQLLYSISHKPRSLHVRGRDMGQTKRSKWTSNIFFPKMVLIRYLTAVCASWCANNQWCCLPLVDTMETAGVLAVAPNDIIRARWQWPCSGYFDIIFVQSGGSGGMLSIFLYSHWVNQWILKGQFTWFKHISHLCDIKPCRQM